jgi:DNA-directed RNA polymerase subunit RPC12/RpoP
MLIYKCDSCGRELDHETQLIVTVEKYWSNRFRVLLCENCGKYITRFLSDSGLIEQIQNV